MPSLNADRRAILLMTLGWAAALLIIRPWGNFPSNDDWSWALAVDALVTHHTWRLTDFTGMPLATQVVWGSLFCLPGGFSFMAVRLSTLVLAWFALLGIHTLLSECGATSQQASVGTVAVLLSPLFFALSLTFMTDVPFLVCAVWAVLCTIRYQRDGRASQFAAVIAWLVAATLERQTGLPIAVAVAMALAVSPGRWLQAVSAVAVPLVALTAYSAALTHFGAPFYYNKKGGYLFEAMLSGSPLILRAAAVSAVGAYVSLGVLMAPVVLASRLTRWRSRIAAVLGAALVIVPGAGVLYKRQWMPIDMNILRDVGLNPILLARQDLWPRAPHALWVGITLAGLVCAAIVWRELLLLGVRDWPTLAASRRSFGPIALLSTCFVLSTMPLWFVQTFNRYYLWPFVLLLALWTRLRAPTPDRAAPGRPRLAAVLVLGCLAVFDIGALHDYYAFTRARWAAVDVLRAEGISGDDIDGGFEVNGLLSYHPERPFDEAQPWYFPKKHPAALLSLGTVEGYTSVASYGFPRWLPPGTGMVYVLRPMATAAAR